MDVHEDIPRLFGTSGIRGKVGEEITLELVMNIGLAISTQLGGKGKVVVGYDSRTSNQMMEKALSAGIIQGGCNVLTLGLAPTPLVGYATNKLQADAGVMITASHNPPQDNGIKVWDSKGMAYKREDEQVIEKIVHEKSFSNASWKEIGRTEDVSSITTSYINDLLAFVDIKPGLKVVVDCANGAASYLSPLVLRKAGCKVLTLNCQPDGFFPGRMPEPSEPNLQELMKIVKATKADLGIAHDGDADRMVAVDDNGQMAEFDALLALISSEIGGCVVTTVDASSCIDLTMKKLGEKVIRTKVGDVYVAEAIEKYKASFGGEPSGTWIHPEFCMCPDGILSALRVIELVQKKGSLSSLLENITSYPTLRGKVNCHKSQKDQIMDGVEKKLPHLFENVEEKISIDGIRIALKDGSWVLIRPSGTEANIRVTLGSKTDEEAQKIMEKCQELIESML